MTFRVMPPHCPGISEILVAVEILGKGQQFVAEGVHPKTGKPYTWENGSLLELGVFELVEGNSVTRVQFRRALGVSRRALAEGRLTPEVRREARAPVGTFTHFLDIPTQAIALPLPFSGGRRQVITLATDVATGFSDDQVARIAAVLPALGSGVELYSLRGSGLLNIYVGHDAGERILRGEIKRGSGDTINAIIWFCDLASFTPLTKRMPRDALIALLNR